MSILSRWRARRATRVGLLAHARRQAAFWRARKKTTKGAAHSHAGYMLDQREHKVAKRKSQVAEADRVVARHTATTGSRRGSFGLDWAWGSPSTSALKEHGVRFAARYLSHDGGKNLSAVEAKRLAAAGIDVVVVWETTANRALGGENAGRVDAFEALRQAKACGIPSDRPIYFAVDFDGTVGQVAAYFRGAAAVLGRNRVGVYGSARIVSGLVGGSSVRWGWQTYAWSGGAVSPKAHLYQYSNGHRVGGVSCDYNKALADDFGQWRP
jgi:hypothetical protein